MDDRKLLGFGIAGAAVAAVCCFTPLLVALLAAIGLSAAVGWLDYVLLPALAVFAGIVIYALVRQRRHGAGACAAEREGERHV
jgi:mercuric ion transport protein